MKLDLQFFASGVITADAVKSSSNTKLQMKVEWSSEVSEEKDNTSIVTTKLYGRRADSLSGATTHSKWSGKVQVGENTAHTFSSVSNTSVSTTWVLFKTYIDEVEHELDGTKEVEIYGSLTGPTGTTLAGVTSSKSAIVELDKIPRQSNLEEISRFDVDMGFMFNAEKPVDTFYRKLIVKNGDTILREILEEDLVNGYEYLLSDDINTIYEIMSSEIEHTFTFELYTYEDSTMATQIGSVSTQTGVGYITDCNPTFSGFDCVDSNAVTVALTGDNTVFIPSQSNAEITIETPATAYKGASIVGYNIIGNRIEYVPISEYPMVHTIYEVSSSFGIQAVDSRGLVSNTIYKNLTWVSGYVAPRLQNFQLIREGGVSENVLITFSGTIWEGNFGNGENKITHVRYRVKSNGGDFGEWFDITDQVNITTPTFIVNESNGIYIHENGTSDGFSTGASYLVELMIYDGIEATTFNSSYATAILDDGKVLDSYYKAGSGYRYAINGIVDPEGDVLQVYDDNGNLIEFGSGGTSGSLDSVPIDSIFDYEGDTVPDGFVEVDDPTCYHDGDTYIIPTNAYINVGGCITSSKKQIRFGIFVPKSLKNISSITVDYAKIAVRYHTGGYLLNMVDVTTSMLAQNEGENAVYLCYQTDTALNCTNNIPVSVEINGLNLKFNE